MLKQQFKFISLLVMVLAGTGFLLSMTTVSARSPQVEHKVFIAFGFHVNLYHSFRNDTNDEHGFGKDIKVIRHIINTLDQFNDQGVPVQAVWDFDNLFSLQERLPQYAPDIISNIKRRVNNGDDEVILMSYNNGLASAMTRQELNDAMAWAVSNPWGSGVKDIFGRYSPIVRPQEMMTTPGNFSIYKEQGIKAVSLYYSATPFDAFRVFSRPLTQTEAYNPITYQNPRTREEMTIIPTYHIGDLLEHVSLRHWATTLHQLQQKGKIDHDVLIYINYDADSEFWSGLELNWPLDRLPNTGGLAALIDEVKDLDFLEFTTLNTYLKSHPSVGTFSFGQDTADGSFDGYNSWAEKAQSHEYWTRIEHHRRFYRMASQTIEIINHPALKAEIQPILRALYLSRMRALSTTNFGMATPFLAPEREKAVATLLNDMDAKAGLIRQRLQLAARNHFQEALHPKHLPEGYQWLDTVWIADPKSPTADNSRQFLNITLSGPKISGRQLSLMKPDGRIWPAKVIHQRYSAQKAATRMKLYLPESEAMPDGICYLVAAPPPSKPPSGIAASARRLKNAKVELRFGLNGSVEGLFVDGIRQLNPGSLTPYFRYWGAIEQPDQLKVIPVVHTNGVSSVRLTGHWKSPDYVGKAPGTVDYQFSLIDDLPYLFVDGRLNYPSTFENDIFKADTPALARRTDLGWQEAAPMELRFAHRTGVEDPVRILKHNFLGISSSYPLDYFRHSKDNYSLDNINNHITSAFFAMVAGGNGMAVAMDTHLCANFAFAPVKVRYDNAISTFSVRTNPFGTYHGRQYRHPTWGNRQGYELALITGEQFHSAGPTYNGASTSFGTMLTFFNGSELSEKHKMDLIRYARSPEVLSLTRKAAPTPNPEPFNPPSEFEALHVETGLYFRWQSPGPKAAKYRIHLGEQPGIYQRVLTTTQTYLQTRSKADGLNLTPGRKYYAAIEAVASDGTSSGKSPEIEFTDDVRKLSYPPQLSLNFKLKVLWANISAYLSRYAI